MKYIVLLFKNSKPMFYGPYYAENIDLRRDIKSLRKQLNPDAINMLEFDNDYNINSNIVSIKKN